MKQSDIIEKSKYELFSNFFFNSNDENQKELVDIIQNNSFGDYKLIIVVSKVGNGNTRLVKSCYNELVNKEQKVKYYDYEKEIADDFLEEDLTDFEYFIFNHLNARGCRKIDLVSITNTITKLTARNKKVIISFTEDENSEFLIPFLNHTFAPTLEVKLGPQEISIRPLLVKELQKQYHGYKSNFNEIMEDYRVTKIDACFVEIECAVFSNVAIHSMKSERLA
jgi:chromosomal replication initiation ATPase DnaA